MPRGPDGQQRPSDTVKCAVTVSQIATGEIDDERVSRRRNGGLKGGKARAKWLSPERRSEIARNAAAARWGNALPRSDT